MLSIAVTSILAVLLTRISSYRVTLAIFLLLAVISLSTLVRQFPLSTGLFSSIRRSTGIMLGMMVVWFLLLPAARCRVPWQPRGSQFANHVLECGGDQQLRIGEVRNIASTK